MVGSSSGMVHVMTFEAFPEHRLSVFLVPHLGNARWVESVCILEFSLDVIDTW